MADEQNKPKRAPPIPPKPIDEAQVAALAERFWTYKEIAAFFRVEESTIKRRFKDVVNEAKERGKGKIRDLQWVAAESGDAKAILHLSRHHLGEHEQKLVKVEAVPNKMLAREIEARLLADDQARAALGPGEAAELLEEEVQDEDPEEGDDE